MAETIQINALTGWCMKQCDDAVQKALEVMPKVILDTFVPLVIRRLPSANQERFMLSRDTTGHGDPHNGRFVRSGSGGQMSVRDAVQSESVIPRFGKGFLFGNVLAINAKSGFGWFRHDHVKGTPGTVPTTSHTTQPFDKNYIMALEKGGTWRVVPRPGRKYLQPEDGMRRSKMTKQLNRRDMFWVAANNPRVASEFIDKIKGAINAQ